MPARALKEDRLWAGMLAAAAVAAVVFRWTALGYGLPSVFNSDEPHHVNVAMSFGAGSLNPHVFKYPTLWMYGLFGVFGTYFLAWSGLGLLHSARQFGELFVWHPEGFFLLARFSASVFSLIGLHRVWRSGTLIGGRGVGLWAAALLAASPALVISAHAAKPDSLMFFWATWAWFFALNHHQRGRRRDLLACGACVGAAVSTQYVAAPLAFLAAAAWWRSRRSADLALMALCGAAAFFAGSPFVLLDWNSFLRDIRDLKAAAETAGVPGFWAVAGNAAGFSGSRLVGGAALAAGCWRLLRTKGSLAALLILPLAGQILFLSLSPDGGWERFLEGGYPALALIAASGVDGLIRRGRVLALALLLLPGAARSFAFDREMLLPDTRNLAAGWIEDHIPAGSRVLADQEHSCPRLRMSRAQVAGLLDATRRNGHPRQRIYELMLGSHPGGGYEVYRVERSFSGLSSGPRHAEWSNQGRAVLDVRSGLDPVRAAGIDVVVLSGYGANPRSEPELARYLEETRREGVLLAEFLPEEGRVGGPPISLYRIPATRGKK